MSARLLWRTIAACSIAAAELACECGGEAPEPDAPALPPMIAGADEQPPSDDAEPERPIDPRDVTLHRAGELASIDASQLVRLDLAFSDTDRIGHMDDGDATTACADLDLVRLATSAPNLESLRISGCPEAVRAGLGAFGPSLAELELSDIDLDEVMVGRLGQLPGLRRLTLRRVKAQTEEFQPLRRLDLREITLAELARDSELSMMLDLWPKRLEKIAFIGSWAGHKAMLTLSKAESLRRVELRDTRVGNFSLNQIKPLEKLEEVIYVGNTFNDQSPLYLRDLPVQRFVCECPRMGDGGLRSLRHTAGLRALELRGTAVTGAGLTHLEPLLALETIVLDVDVGSEGFEALSKLGRLSRLELEGELDDPTMEGLGLLASLEELVLRVPTLDDRAAPQLGKLTELRVLDLGRTRISDAGLAAMAGLTRLEVLRLHHTQVTNRGLEHIARMKALRVLELDHTDVVDAGVAHLRPLQNLQELRLDSTLVTDAGIDHLVALQGLRRLNLAQTVVTDAGVAKLRVLPNLEVVGLAGTRAE
jgi:hypothetical protein